MADQSKFGGIAVQDSAPSKFGGVAVVDGPTPPKTEDRGFLPTLIEDVTSAPKKLMDWATGNHPIDAALNAVRDLTAARKSQQQRAVDAYKAGDYKAAAEHALFSVPVIGPMAGAAADEFTAGKPGEGSAHLVEQALPLLGPAGDLMRSGAVSTAGTAIRGGARGALSGATEMIPINRYGVELKIPAVAAGGAAGGLAARSMGLPAEAGAAVGAATPIVRGAIAGSREALAARAAAELAKKPLPTPAWASAVPDAEAPPPAFTSRQGPMGMDTEGNMVPGPLPSGRIPGRPVPAAPVPSRAPAWRTAVPDAAPVATPPPVAAAPPALPSGRVPGTGVPVEGPAAAPAAATPMGVQAYEVGNLTPKQFAKLSPESQAQLQRVADALNRSKTVAAPAAPGPAAPVGRVDIGPPSPGGPSAVESLRLELERETAQKAAARQQAAQPAPAPQQAPQPAPAQPAPAPVPPPEVAQQPPAAQAAPAAPNVAQQFRDAVAPPGTPINEAGVATIPAGPRRVSAPQIGNLTEAQFAKLSDASKAELQAAADRINGPQQPIISEEATSKPVNPAELNMRIADEARRNKYQGGEADPATDTARGAHVDDIVQGHRQNWAQALAMQFKRAGMKSEAVDALDAETLDKVAKAAKLSPASERSPATIALFHEILDNLWAKGNSK